MSVTQLVASAVLAISLVLAVMVTLWLWRDMRGRGRPRWLCALVPIASFLFLPVGMAVFLLDDKHHPHEPDLSIRDRLLLPFRSSRA